MAYQPLNDTIQVAQNLSTGSTSNSISVANLSAYNGANVQITGTWTGTLIFEASTDGGTNYYSVQAQAVAGNGATLTTVTANGQWVLNITGASHFRVRCSVTGTGTAVVSIRASIAAPSIGLNLPLPSGTNLIGYIGGDVAHDAADSGNPLKFGGVARSSEQTAVANGDRVNAAFDLVGKQIVLPYCNPENGLNGTGNATGTSDTAVISAQGAGIKIFITTIIVNNTSTTDTFVNIKDGSTTKLVVPAPQKSGAILTLPTPLVLTANNALNFASSTGVTTMYVSAVGYKGV